MQIEGACHCGLISFTAEIDASRVMACLGCVKQRGRARSFGANMAALRDAMAVGSPADCWFARATVVHCGAGPFPAGRVTPP